MSTKLSRAGLLAVLVVVSACGGVTTRQSDGASPGRLEPQATMTESVVDCPRFEELNNRMLKAQQALIAGSDVARQLDQLKTDLHSLEQGAPRPVVRALKDLALGFRIAADPTQGVDGLDSDLAAASRRLADAGRTVTEFVQSQCS